MEYSDDNLARIRAALLDYHAATRSNGRKRSWSAIAGSIAEKFEAVAPSEKDDEDDLWDDDAAAPKDPNKPLAEALRRFAAGTQTPSRERLDAICGYLKDKKFLTDADLRPAEAGHPLLHALTNLFGSAQELSSAGIEGRFIASRKRGARPMELSRLTVSVNGKGAPVVEDRLYSLPVAPQSTEREALLRLLSRTGGSEQRFDGWLFSAKGQTCVVVQDSLRGEASIHTVVERRGEKAQIMLILKSNDFGFPPAGYSQSGLRHVAGGDTLRDGALEKIKGLLWEYKIEAGSDGE